MAQTIRPAKCSHHALFPLDWVFRSCGAYSALSETPPSSQLIQVRRLKQILNNVGLNITTGTLLLHIKWHYKGVSKMSLLQIITDGDFPQLSDLDAVVIFGSAFKAELEWLKSASPTIESSRGSPVGSLGRNNCMPSVELYGSEYPEVDRTLISLLGVKWLLAGDYDTFTCGQPLPAKLKNDSFKRLRGLLTESCSTAESILALMIAIAVNDIGKSNDFASEVANSSGQTFENHDEVVNAAAQQNLIPTLNMLDSAARSDILLGLEFGSRLNVAQFAQAECVAANLKGIGIVSDKPRALAWKMLEVIMDVAGAGGHVDSRGAAQMTEPVFQAYLAAYEAVLGIQSGQMTIHEGYDYILQSRMRLLHNAGLEASLSIDKPSDHALIRLLTMGRVVDPERADRFIQAFGKLESGVRQSLVNALNIDSVDGQAAILFVYGPGLISEALKNSKDNAQEISVLEALFQFFARVYNYHKESSNLQDSKVREINLSFAQDTVKSTLFSENPGTLDSLPIPALVQG